MKSDISDKKTLNLMRSAVPDSWMPLFLVYRYGMLTVILGLLASTITSLSSRPPGMSSDPYAAIVLSITLLLYHLALCFEWRESVCILLIVVASIWALLGFVYIVYLSPCLYP